MKNRIITFSCSSYVHVYEPECGLTPAWPYKVHESVKEAKKYLESRGKLNVEKIIHRANSK